MFDINDLKSALYRNITAHREAMTNNLARIAAKAAEPLDPVTDGMSPEVAMMKRTGEIGKLVGEQHSRCHQIKAMKNVLRTIRHGEQYDDVDDVLATLRESDSRIHRERSAE